MKVFKDTERTTIANETLFKRTLSCLANVNWNRTRDCDDYAQLKTEHLSC